MGAPDSYILLTFRVMVCVCACLHAPKPSVSWLLETPTVTYNVNLPVHNREPITKKKINKKNTQWFASASAKNSKFVTIFVKFKFNILNKKVRDLRRQVERTQNSFKNPSTKMLWGFSFTLHLSSEMKRGHELDHGGLPSSQKTIKTSVAITKRKKYWSLRDGMGSRRALEAVNHIVHHVYLCVNHVEGHKSLALIGQRCRHRKRLEALRAPPR